MLAVRSTALVWSMVLQIVLRSSTPQFSILHSQFSIYFTGNNGESQYFIATQKQQEKNFRRALKMHKFKFKQLLSVVLAVMLAVSNVVSGVTPAVASGLIGIDQLQGGGGASVHNETTGKYEASDNAKTIYFGSFWQSAEGTATKAEFNKNNYKREGVQWRVLLNDEANGKVLLLSDKALFARKFDDSSNVWANSEVREA